MVILYVTATRVDERENDSDTDAGRTVDDSDTDAGRRVDERESEQRHRNKGRRA